ncbi:MAG TPA: hypothetical protein VLM79_21775 [Kofleriaceae bacterium]|nr:hypothetical protein [Kofleriaceae bacterium]
MKLADLGEQLVEVTRRDPETPASSCDSISPWNAERGRRSERMPGKGDRARVLPCDCRSPSLTSPVFMVV